MKDRDRNQIYKGDVVAAIVKSKGPHSLSYTITGVVEKVARFKTGYGMGGFVEVIEHRSDNVSIVHIIRDSKYLSRYSNEKAMLWKLENS